MEKNKLKIEYIFKIQIILNTDNLNTDNLNTDNLNTDNLNTDNFIQII